MMWRVLIIGGYGNFGSFISKTLAKEPNIQVIVAGRSAEKSKQFILGLDTVHKAEGAVLNINNDTWIGHHGGKDCMLKNTRDLHEYATTTPVKAYDAALLF